MLNYRIFNSGSQQLIKMQYIYHSILFLWLACGTQEEIAEKENVSVQVVKDVVSDISENLPKNLKTLADHAEPDFVPPIYNIWKTLCKTYTCPKNMKLHTFRGNFRTLSEFGHMSKN